MHRSMAISRCVSIQLVRKIRGLRPFTACSPGYAAAGHLLLQDLSTYVRMNMTCSPKYTAADRLWLEYVHSYLVASYTWSAPTTTMYNLNTRMAPTRSYRLIQTAWSCTHVHVWFPNHRESERVEPTTLHDSTFSSPQLRATVQNSDCRAPASLANSKSKQRSAKPPKQPPCSSAYKYSAIGRRRPRNTWSQIAARLLHCARHPPKRHQAAGKEARVNCRGRRPGEGEGSPRRHCVSEGAAGWEASWRFFNLSDLLQLLH
jgi:hypothetical protein